MRYLAFLFVWFALSGASAAELRIGVAAPLSGPDAVFGEQMRRGVEQAITDLDGAGGFTGGRARMIARDDGNTASGAAAVAHAFVAEHIPIVIGHFSSAATVAASAVYADAGVLDLTPSAVAPLVTDRSLPTVFRTCGRDDRQAAIAARFLLSRPGLKVAIVHDRSSQGKALADGVREALANAGAGDVLYGSFERGGHEFSGLVSRIKASTAQVLVFGGSATDAGQLARQLREANARVTLMGGAALASDDFATTAGSAADGTWMVFPRDPKSRPAATDLLGRLRAKGIEPGAFVFYAYAAIQIVQQAARSANSLEPNALAATMHSGQTFDTVLGPIAFDKAGDPIVSDYAIYVWHKGATGRMTFDDQARS